MANTSPKGLRPPTQDETSSATPVATFRFGQVSAAVFSDQGTLPGGKTFPRLSVSLRRSYKTAEGTWEHTHSLRTADLLPAAFALFQCAEYIAQSHASDGE